MLKTFIDNTIDQVVVAKKAVVDVSITNPQVKKVLTQFVDTQATYTREALHANADMFNGLVEVAMDRTPYAELQKQLEKYFPMAYCATPKKAK